MSPSPMRATILFVDDDVDVLDVLSRTFARTYQVLTASSIAQALHILSSQSVDLLVTDQKFSDGSGIELVARARELGIDITAILLTGFAEPQDLIDAINKGQVYRYVTKPWDVTEFTLTIKNALDHQALRKDRERLLNELSRRMEALNVLNEVSQSDAGLLSYEAIVSRGLEAIGRVISFDIGSALIDVEPEQPATLQLHCHEAGSDAALLCAKETTLSQWSALTNAPLDQGKAIIRITGRHAPTASGATARSTAMAPIMVAGKVVGMIMLFAEKAGVFGENDLRILEALAKQIAGAVRNLSTVLHAERRRIERMVECMADGAVLTDADNEVLVINPAARSLLDMQSSSLAHADRLWKVLGVSPSDLVRGWESGGARIVREEVKISDRTVHCTVSPVTDVNGYFAGVVVVLRDISEQKALEARKEEIVSVISHELRTPLTAISGAIDLVLNGVVGDISEKQRRFLDMAKDSADKLNCMVDDLLDLSKHAHGKMRMFHGDVAYDDLVKKAVETFRPAAMEEHLSMEMRLPSKIINGVGDYNRLTQVLNNLLSNAIKFCCENGRIEIDLFAPRQENGYVVLTVWNDGDPIAEIDLERIFNKFEQGSSPRARAMRGTGLGLSICRGIVEAHGGRIWAENSHGKRGARFVVVLPLEPRNDGVRSDLDNKSALSVSAWRDPVLVVDDEPDVAYLLKAFLLADGYQVRVAMNADDAINLAGKHNFKLIIAEARMLKIDDSSVIKILRQQPLCRDAKIMAFSTQPEGANVLHVMQMGADDYLVQPYDASELISGVEGLLRDAEWKVSAAKRMPGAAAVEHAVRLRLDAGDHFAFCCLELEGLAEYCDRFGYAKVENIMQQASDLLRETVGQEPDSLLGQVSSDEFVFLVATDRADAVCQKVIDSFDRLLALYNHTEERPGFMQTPSPVGHRRSSFIDVLMVAVASGSNNNDYVGIVNAAANLKVRARQRSGCRYLRDNQDKSKTPSLSPACVFTTESIKAHA